MRYFTRMSNAGGIERYTQFVHSANRVYVRNVLNPLLWLCGIGCPLLFLTAREFRDVPWIRGTAFIIGVLLLLVTIAAFIYFAIRDPDRLQSEEYSLQIKRLQMMMQGKTEPILIDATSSPASANPVPPALKPGEGENK